VKEFLSEKYGKLSDSEFKENKMFNEDLIENDICVTVKTSNSVWQKPRNPQANNA
jgi:hypothetical protein